MNASRHGATSWWALAAIGGAVVVATGWLPAVAAEDIALGRAGPVLGFLVAVTILAEFAERAGVFEFVADVGARLGRGSTPGLFLLVAVLAAVTTVVLSIDTTAVLLTPVVIVLARRLDLPVVPFALLVLWIANTASLLLPVSNLTNLLAQQRIGLSATEFAARMAVPESVAVALTIGYLGLRYRRELGGRYRVPPVGRPADPWSFGWCLLCCTGMVLAVLLGVAPVWAAGAAALAAGALAAVRDRGALRWSLVPWRLVVFTEGLFLVVVAAARHGLTTALASMAGESPWRGAAVAALAGNLVNNLPGYLAMEAAVPADDRTRLLAVLIGTNAGPLVTVWGSLATVLWLQRCRSAGLDLGWRTLLRDGLPGAVLVVAGATGALLLVSPM